MLTLDVVKAMSLVFYRDGVLGSTIPVQEGQNAGGVSLTLIKSPVRTRHVYALLPRRAKYLTRCVCSPRAV